MGGAYLWNGEHSRWRLPFHTMRTESFLIPKECIRSRSRSSIATFRFRHRSASDRHTHDWDQCRDSQWNERKRFKKLRSRFIKYFNGRNKTLVYAKTYLRYFIVCNGPLCEWRQHIPYLTAYRHVGDTICHTK